MNKRIRDKAISSSPMVTIATYRGEDWHTDTFIATKYPILEGYKPRKHQVDLTEKEKPELDAIINNNREYSLAEFEEANEDRTTSLWRTVNDIKVKLATRYVELVRDICPGALPFVTTDGTLSPVKFYNGEELVAVVMPIYN